MVIEMHTEKDDANKHIETVVIENNSPMIGATLKVRFEIPIIIPQKELKEQILPQNVSIEEIVRTCYQPIVDSLANYIKAISFSGEVGATAGVPLLQSSILEATIKMGQIYEQVKKTQEANA